MKFGSGVVVIFALILGITSITRTITAQAVIGPEMKLITFSPTVSIQRGERLCGYFLWSNLGSDVQHVAFQYTNFTEGITIEAPQIGNVSIVLNPVKVAPTAQLIGMDAHRQGAWRLSMSQYVYGSNARCLADVPIVAPLNQ